MQNIDVEWAVKIFRPLLQALSVQNKENKPVYIETSEYRQLIVKGMGRCLVYFKLSDKLEHDVQGYFIFSYKSEYEIFVLNIVLNRDLYERNDLECKIERKAIAVHEFIHCIASMLSISRLHKDSSTLIRSLKEQIDKKNTTISTKNKQVLFHSLYKIEETAISNLIYERFDDSHYRLNFEDFSGDYAELYRTLLLSYDVINDVIKKDFKEELIKLLKERQDDELVSFLNEVVNSVAFKKALKRDFVILRMRKILYSIELHI